MDANLFLIALVINAFGSEHLIRYVLLDKKPKTMAHVSTYSSLRNASEASGFIFFK